MSTALLSFRETVCEENAVAPGVQTERRAWRTEGRRPSGVRPLRGLLGGEISAAVWFQDAGIPLLFDFGITASIDPRAEDGEEAVRGVIGENAVADRQLVGAGVGVGDVVALQPGRVSG